MLQVTNQTPFKAVLMPIPDADGIDTVFTVVKATFTIGERIVVADEQVPVTLESTHWGDPLASSIRSPSDISLAKPGTDVMLIGSAWAPMGRPARRMDVSFSVGPVSRTARIFGDRFWRSGAAGASASEPEPFERIPLVWERAFGGRDETPKGVTAEPRNPVGAGFRASDGNKPLDGLALPNIEDPVAPVSSWKDRPAPVCFAPIGAHWQPRISYAGTYDDAWQASRSPFLPADFDPRYSQCAPAELVAPGHLEGGEIVDVQGATPGGVLQFALPMVRIRTTYRVDGGTQVVAAALDTVIVEPDAARLVMVWRAGLSCDKRVLKVREVEVTLAGAA